MRHVKVQKKKITVKTKIRLIAGIAALIGVVVFFITAPGLYVRRQVSDFCALVSDRAGLTLEHVDIIGHNRTRKEDVQRALNLVQGASVFSLNLHDIQMKIGALPWVDSVSVERHLPNTLVIKVQEKTPIAIWQNAKKYFPLDETGQPILDDKTVLKNLLLVVGPDAPEHTPDMIEMLEKHPILKQRAVAAVRVGERRWNLVLDDVSDGITVYLPEKDIAGALARLQELEEGQNILGQNFSVIDLRIEDRLIVRAASRTEKEGKK